MLDAALTVGRGYEEADASGERLRLWGVGGAEGLSATIVTHERLACLGEWWCDGDEAAFSVNV